MRRRNPQLLRLLLTTLALVATVTFVCPAMAQSDDEDKPAATAGAIIDGEADVEIEADSPRSADADAEADLDVDIDADADIDSPRDSRSTRPSGSASGDRKADPEDVAENIDEFLEEERDDLRDEDGRSDRGRRSRNRTDEMDDRDDRDVRTRSDVRVRTDRTERSTESRFSAESMSSLGLRFDERDDGLVVSRITTQSVFADTALRPGDQILAVDGRTVTTIGGFGRWLSLADPSARIALRVLRNGRRLTIYLPGTVVERFTVNRRVPARTYRARERGILGLDLADNRYGEVWITRVWGSPALEAGLRPRDLILAIDGEPVGSVDEVQDLIADRRPYEEVEFDIARGDRERTLVATLLPERQVRMADRRIVSGYRGRVYDGRYDDDGYYDRDFDRDDEWEFDENRYVDRDFDRDPDDFDDRVGERALETGRRAVNRGLRRIGGRLLD